MIDKPQTAGLQRQMLGLGVLFGCFAALFSTLMSVMVKLIGNEASVGMLVFFRFLVSTLLMLPWALFAKNFKWKIQRPLTLFTRTFFALLSLVCLFYILGILPVANALVLNNTAPLFVPIVAYIMTGGKTPIKAVIGIIIGFIGVVCILNPGAHFLNPVIFVGLASGAFAAIAYIQIRQLSKINSPEQVVFYYFLLSTLLSAFALPLDWRTPKNETWLLIFLMGVFGAIYQYCITRAFSHSPVRLTASLMFLSVVLGGLIDWIFWNEIPRPLTLIGMALVVTGGMVTIFYGARGIKRSRKPLTMRKPKG